MINEDGDLSVSGRRIGSKKSEWIVDTLIEIKFLSGAFLDSTMAKILRDADLKYWSLISLKNVAEVSYFTEGADNCSSDNNRRSNSLK